MATIHFPAEPAPVATKSLFVCGCPRSGTSFLHGILTHHPAIAIGLERFKLRTFARKTMPTDFTRERFFRMEPGDTWYDDLSRSDGLRRDLDAKYDAADLALMLPIVSEDPVAGDGPLTAEADFLDVDPAPLRKASRHRSCKEPPPPPGSGVGSLESEDAAFVNAAADHDALDRVVHLARRPERYRGAARTVQPPPRLIATYFAPDSTAFVHPRSQPAGSRIELRNPPEADTLEPAVRGIVVSASRKPRLEPRPG